MDDETKIRLGLMSLSGIIGGVVGTLDVCTTGYPFFSVGLPLYELTSAFWSFQFNLDIYRTTREFVRDEAETSSIRKVDRFKNYAAYLLGAGLPFTGYYAKDIADLLVGQ